jgi:hypothetical protein
MCNRLNRTQGTGFESSQGFRVVQDPDTPDSPDTPDTPDTSDTPDTPNTPDAPDSFWRFLGVLQMDKNWPV